MNDTLLLAVGAVAGATAAAALLWAGLVRYLTRR